MQPYRLARVADAAGVPSALAKAELLLQSNSFDGIRFNYIFVCNGDASATIEVWFYDSKNETWIPDEELKRELGEMGSGTFRVETNGRPMLLKIVALDLPAAGAPPAPPPHLLITQGAYSDSKV
ncbi:hypothetical protein EON83_10890 [bacterium]|nr:MAG: hypothetical protein EON83_10890 [bacterium]